MTFFVTSVPAGTGGNLGGLTGADKKCQDLAAAVNGGDHQWKAYLSVGNNGNPVSAASRIGAGPWKNQKGKVIAQNLAELHGAGFNIKNEDNLDEKGQLVPRQNPNRHDILTGTFADGGVAQPIRTCSDWTSQSAAGNQNDTANQPYVGHSDSDLTGNNQADRWNSAHPGQGCTLQNLQGQGGEGRIYCFAVD